MEVMNGTSRVFAVLCVVLLGCHPPTSAAPGGAPVPVVLVRDRSGLDVPTRVGRYTLQPPDSAAAAASGDTPYHFSDGSSTRVTVFVYAVPADVQEGEVPQAWATAEGAKFVQVLRIGVERGWYEDFQVAFSEPQPVVRDTLGIPGHAVAAATRSRGGVRVELEYLYLVRGRFLKVRATVPERGWTQTDVPRFAEQLALAIAGQ
jgi:hypothetical protein